jgi:hypothetical protein
MAKQTINIGSSANDRTGDPLRTAFGKVNANFTELYSAIGADVQIPIQTGNNGLFLTTNGSTLSWATTTSITNGGSNVNIATANNAPTITRGATTVGPTSYPAATWTFGTSTTKTLLIPGNITGPSQMTLGNTDGYGISIDSANTPKSMDFGSIGTTEFLRFRFGTDTLSGHTSDVEIQTIPRSGVGSSPTAIVLSPQGGQNGSFVFGGTGTLTLPNGGVITGSGSSAIAFRAPASSQAVLENNAGYNLILAQDQDVRITTSPDAGSTYYTWNFGTNGKITFPNNYTFTGQTLTDNSGTTNYSLKIANGTTGSVFAVGTGTEGFGVANDSLNHNASGYVPYNATASTMSFNVPGYAGSLTINGAGVVTVTNGFVISGTGKLTFPDATVQTTAYTAVKTAYNVSDATVTMGIITVSWSAQVGNGPRLVYTISNSSNITMQYTVTNIIAGVTTSDNSGVWTQHPSDPPFFEGALVNLGDIQIMYLQDMTNHKIYRITGVNTQGGGSGGHAYGSILIEQII